MTTESLGWGSVTLASTAELAIDYGNVVVSNAITSNGGTLSFANYGGSPPFRHSERPNK